MARPLALLLALAALAAAPVAEAASAKSKPPKHLDATPPVRPPPLDPTGMGREIRPSHPLALLTHGTESETRARLGAPDVARTEGLGALWTYRLGDCALLIFFNAEDGRTLRVSGAAASARRRGEPPPPLAACIDQAEARKSGQTAAR